MGAFVPVFDVDCVLSVCVKFELPRTTGCTARDGAPKPRDPPNPPAPRAGNTNAAERGCGGGMDTESFMAGR